MPGVSSSAHFPQNPSSRCHRLCTRSLTLHCAISRLCAWHKHVQTYREPTKIVALAPESHAAGHPNYPNHLQPRPVVASLNSYWKQTAIRFPSKAKSSLIRRYSVSCSSPLSVESGHDSWLPAETKKGEADSKQVQTLGHRKGKKKKWCGVSTKSPHLIPLFSEKADNGFPALKEGVPISPNAVLPGSSCAHYLWHDTARARGSPRQISVRFIE